MVSFRSRRWNLLSLLAAVGLAAGCAEPAPAPGHALATPPGEPTVTVGEPGDEPSDPCEFDQDPACDAPCGTIAAPLVAAARPGWVLADPGGVSYTTGHGTDDGVLVRYDHAASAATSLSGPAGALGRLAGDVTHVYWIAYTVDGAVARRVPLAGGTTESLPAERPQDVAVDATHAYLSEWRSAGPAGAIVRLPKSGGGTEEVLVSEQTPIELLVDETRVFWIELADAPRIAAAPKAGGERTLVWEAPARYQPQILVQDESHLYVLADDAGAEGGESAILRVAKDGRGAELLVAPGAIHDLAIADGVLYYTETAAPSEGSDFRFAAWVRALPVTGGEPATLWEGTSHPLGIATDGVCVYFAVGSFGEGEGAIWSVRR